MRLTGTNRNTILELLALIGGGCERLLVGRMNKLPVVDVQVDEVWGFVAMKDKTRERKELEFGDVGDCCCCIGIERNTKLILAWHLGRRCAEDAREFGGKLAEATDGAFQIATDGFRPYRTAIPAAMSGADFAMLVKHYATKSDDHKYSPGDATGTTKVPVNGNPVEERIATGHSERQNLTVRMQNRRMTRLTNAFGKKWANHSAAMALHFAYYNFCRPHQTSTEAADRKTTPAMAAQLEAHPWTLAELVEDVMRALPA